MATRIPRETKEIILEAARIEEVVGEFVNLKKRGSSLIGLCPFHNEKTPSFHVTPSRGIFKCFGCGQGGDSVNFLMEHEHYTFPEALQYLATKYNIQIEQEELTPEMEQEISERESQYVVMAYAEQWFTEQLHNSDEGKAIGLSYFRERGFRDDIIEKFRLGYSPDQSHALKDAATEAGYKLEFLKKTGLVKEGQRGDYDGYKGRVLFPIHNLSGRPIGFGGRTLKSDKKIPKYVNTPECDIYHKSKVLYGIYFAKKAIVKENNCYLVEGYTDVISLHQSGIENVVASSGTSLTTDQIRLIKRYTPNITILYDGDPAGIKASFRGIDMILEEGMNVKVVLFPDGEDPDSYAKNHSSSELTDFVSANSKDFIVFKTDLLSADAEGDPIKRAEMIHEVLRSVAIIPDHISRSVYLKECSRLLEIPEKALIAELNKELRSKQKKQDNKQRFDEPPPESFYPPEDPFAAPQEQGVDYTDCSPQETDLVRILLTYSDKTLQFEAEMPEDQPPPQDGPEMIEVPLVGYVCHELALDEMEFENPTHNAILLEFEQALEREEMLSASHFINHENQAISKIAVDLLSSRYELHSWDRHFIPVHTEEMSLKKAVLQALYAYKSKRLAAMIRDLQMQLKQLDKDSGDIMPLLKRQKKLDEVKASLAAHGGRVVLR